MNKTLYNVKMNEELKKVQEQLAQTSNDPDLYILTYNCFNLIGELTIEEQQEACKKCPVRIDFVKRHPNNIYNA